MTNYVAGRAFEYVVRDYFKKNGFDCRRIAGSKGPYDLVAMSQSGLYAIQCKKAKTNQNYEFDKQQLRAVPMPNGTRLMIVKNLKTKMVTMENVDTGNVTHVKWADFVAVARGK